MAEKGYRPLAEFRLESDMKPDIPKPKVRGYDRPGVRADARPAARRPRDRDRGAGGRGSSDRGAGGRGARRQMRN